MRAVGLGASFLAVVVSAAAIGAGCGGGSEEPAAEEAATTTVPAQPAASVTCDGIIGGARYSGTDVGDRFVLRVISVPPEYRPEVAVPSGKPKWPYFAEVGLVVRTDVPPVEVSVPTSARKRAAISWGNAPIAHSHRVASCPSNGLPWNAYYGRSLPPESDRLRPAHLPRRRPHLHGAASGSASAAGPAERYSPGWTRTNNLRINSPPLCQLSYRGRRGRL